MPLIQRSAEVGYSASKMYALVNDIEAYPSFLEGCRVAQVILQAKDHLEAHLILAKGPITYDFTTRNRLVKDSSIEMHLLRGPFKSLKGVWQFLPVAQDRCRIDFELAYESLVPLVDFTLRPFWEGLASSLVDSFCQRARIVYGKS